MSTESITKADVKFILAIGVVFAGIIIWGIRLEGNHALTSEKVDAMVVRELANKMVFEDFVNTTTEKLDKIIGNQIKIASELGIDIER